MPTKLDDPRDIQGAYEDQFNNPSRELYDAETGSSSSYTNAGIDQAEAFANDPANASSRVTQDGEQTNGTWANNTTAGGSGTKVGGAAGLIQKGKVLFKKKGAAAVIIALLGGGATLPFLGSATLPFAIIGNMDAKSMLLGLNKYSEDYFGFRVFGSNKASVQNGKTGQLAGLRDTEITELKKQGLEFRGAKKNSVTGKTTFTSVKLGNGRWVSAGSDFMKEMRTNPVFRKAMVYNKGSYWKSHKSAAAAKVKAAIGASPNPDLKGKNTEEKNKKLYTASTAGTSATFANGVDGSDENKQQADADTQEFVDELNDEVDTKKAQFAEGDIPSSIAKDSNMGNIGTQLDKQVIDVVDASKGLGGKIWGYVNVLDPVDTVCTVYQTANIAAKLATGVALANIMRFSLTIRAAIERAKAGDDDGESLHYLMEMISQKDPETGQSFDATSYASMLFSGQLSAEPSAVSAFGGQAMIALMMGIHGLHAAVGAGNAGSGRSVLKNVCGVATNLGVQITVTIGAGIAAFFTGGAAGAGIAGIKAGFSAGLKKATSLVIEKVTSKFGKEAIKKVTADIAEQGAAKYFSRQAWRGFKGLWNSMSPWEKAGILVAGVSTFGMAYIVDALSGGNIAGYLKNGFAAFDAIGTGWDQYEYLNGIGSGGTVATYATATAYQKTQKELEENYVADMKLEAADTPLDLKTPYSMLGSAVFSMQKMIGLSASTNTVSTLTSLASLPFKLPLMGATASADTNDPTPEEIGEKIGNPYYEENEIALTVTGSPRVIFDKNISFEEFAQEFINGNDPQVLYDGDDETTGEPILNIIAGTKLAEYADKCHNSERTQLDDQLADESNKYDLEACTSSEYSHYDDAVSYINQVNPDAELRAATEESTEGMCLTEPVEIQGEKGIIGGKVKPNARMMVQCVAGAFAGKGITFQTADVRPTGEPGTHSLGLSVDIMIPDYKSEEGKKLGWEVAKWLRDHKKELGIHLLVHSDKIWNDERDKEDWRDYDSCNSSGGCGSDSSRHLDHIHGETWPDQRGTCKGEDAAAWAACLGGGTGGPFEWPLGEEHFKSNKSSYLKGHTSTGTAWGGDGMGTNNKGAGIASDIGASAGTKVYAMFGGEVTSVSLCGSGDGVAIKSKINGKTVGVAYMHGSNQQVRDGQQVKAGQYIMDVGTIGCNVFGAHLHVGVAYDGKYVCPQDIFKTMGAGGTIDFAAFAKKAGAPCNRL